MSEPRHIPSLSEIRERMRSSHGSHSPLTRAQTIADLRLLAKGRAPRAVFDYVDGAADDELSIARSRELFRSLEFAPRVLRDVAEVDTHISIFGKDSRLPFILGPTGFTRMMHTEGERAVARAAAWYGAPYVLSTMGTTTPADVAATAPDLRRWFQLYLWRDRESSRALVASAEQAGFETLILTVDVPVAGNRTRDGRNGATIPPSLTLAAAAEAALHPRWWFDYFTTPEIEFASMRSYDGPVGQLINRMFDPSATLEDIVWIREHWKGRVVVKGVQSIEDAKLVVDAGVDGVVLSNHGGRQLDRSPTPLRLLPKVREAVGTQTCLFLDGGVMNGGDIVAGLALGADAVLIGRAYLYGLTAGGQRGVERALEILSGELVRTMQLLGVTRVQDLHPGLVRLPKDPYEESTRAPARGVRKTAGVKASPTKGS